MKTLAEAARTCDVERIEALLAAGGNPNESESATHWSPLIEAAYGNHAEIVYLLLEAGAEMYAPTVSGETVLHVAVKHRSRDVVRVLRSCGYRPETVRDAACEMLINHLREIETVEWLASEGVDIDATDESGETPLMWAVNDGFVELTAAFLRLGADPNRRDANGKSVVYWALDVHDGVHDALPLLRLLIEAGVDLSAALRDAISVGHEAAVEHVLAYGLDINATDDNGHSFLYYAQARKENAWTKEPMVRLLQQHGARLNNRDAEVLAEDWELGC
jgi:ankyrin repeat protein